MNSRLRFGKKVASACGLLAILSSLVSQASAQSVARFLVAKTTNYRQTSSAAPVLDGATAFQFASLVFRGTAALTGGTLTFTGSASPRTYTVDPSGNLSILDTFATQAQMDAAYGNGNYTVSMNTSEGNFSRTINLLGLLGYPTIPRLTAPADNWMNGSLVIDVTQDYTFTWNSFSNATQLDLIQFVIAGSPVVVQLPATQTSYTVPAGTLPPGLTYSGTLAFVRVAGATTGDAEVGNGVAALVRTNTFSITAIPEPSTWALLGTGAILLLVAARRSAKAV